MPTAHLLCGSHGIPTHSVQIGDGTCVTISSRERQKSRSTGQAVPDNITTSLCQDEAMDLGRCAFFAGDDIPAAIFLGTDGIENSYYSHEQLKEFYKELALNFSKNGLDKGFEQLTEFLPELSRMGSGDDVSCAGIYDPEALIACEESLSEVDIQAEPITVELVPEMLDEDGTDEE